MRVLLGLGTNRGDRVDHLRRAVAAIPDLVAVSPIYETGGAGRPGPSAYLDLVAELDTSLTPRRLLRVCRELERQAARGRGGASVVEVDILWIDGVVVQEDDLTVPNPRMPERSFVMRPLRDLAPDIEVAGWDPDTAIGDAELLGRLDDLELAAVAD